MQFRPLNKPVLNAMTIDVEDWFQSTCDLSREISYRVVEDTHKILELFAEFGVKATFFVLGLVCEKYPGLIVSIKEDGHEIATHGYSHEPLYNLSRQALAEDVRKSIDLIQAATGERVYGYRAPDFSVNASTLWALEVLAENGIKYDSSIFPIYNPGYGIPEWYRFPHRIKLNSEHEIIEFPISTLRAFGLNFPFIGGGYSRLFPIWFTKLGARKINYSERPVITYVHPYEVDTAEIADYKEEILGLTRLSQGFNRRMTRAKLRNLLSSFGFSTVKEVLNLT